MSMQLDSNNLLIDKKILSIGNRNSFILDLLLVNRSINLGNKIIFAHSHLRDLNPSKEDIDISNLLNDRFKQHNICDHLIFNDSDIVSYKKELIK